MFPAKDIKGPGETGPKQQPPGPQRRGQFNPAALTA
jgi:hypothetical protein